MTDQIKISASLQDAQAYMAECLEFVTQDEPLVLDFKHSGTEVSQGGIMNPNSDKRVSVIKSQISRWLQWAKLPLGLARG